MTQSHARHRLVAVMFTDIAGYTAITNRDATQGQAVNEKHKQSLLSLVPEFNGVVQEIIGDGSLSYFPSAIDCVLCAMELQKQWMAEPEVPVRIGIHTGEIQGDSNFIYGSVLNIASRIESIGIAGSVLVSRNVYDNLLGRPEFNWVSLGLYEFKHVSEPLEIFALRNDGFNVPSRESVSGKLRIQERKDIIVFNEWDDTELVERLQTAHLVCQQAVCSYSFINYNYSTIRRFLENGGKLQCVFVHPDSPAIQMAPERQIGAAQNIEYIAGQVNLAFQKLRSLPRQGIELRLTHHLPEPIMTFIDPESEQGVLFITLSGFRMDLHCRPSFLLRKSTHQRWFDFYYQSFLNLWESENTRAVDLEASWAKNLASA